MAPADGHPLRDLRRCITDVAHAVAESVFYRRTIFDPPPGWPARWRIILRPRKAKR